MPRISTTKSTAVNYTTMSGYDNGHGWTTQNYGTNTIWIPWTGSGYNVDVGTPLPTPGQIVTDSNGNSAVVDYLQDNPGPYDTKVIHLTTSVPGFASDGIVSIGGSPIPTGLKITGGFILSNFGFPYNLYANQINGVDSGGTYDSNGFVSDYAFLTISQGFDTWLNANVGVGNYGAFYATWGPGSTDSTPDNSNVVIAYLGSQEIILYPTPTGWTEQLYGTWNMPVSLISFAGVLP